MAIAGGACGQEVERPTGASGPGGRSRQYLAAEYPERFDAGERVVRGALIARGDSLYHGLIGRANCILCHGPFLSGGSHGTNLRDQKWHHGDGSYSFLVAVITDGVEQSDQSPIPGMPPRGGTSLSRPEINALAAYVYWISNTRSAAEGGTHSSSHEHGSSH